MGVELAAGGEWQRAVPCLSTHFSGKMLGDDGGGVASAAAATIIAAAAAFRSVCALAEIG